MRIRTLLKFGLIFTILILALGKIFVFLKSDMFKISQIEINGDYYISNPGLIDVIEGFEGKNIWYINAKKIEEYVHEDIRVKSLTLKKILPDTLIVNIEERHPYAYVLLNNRIYVTDKEGVIFAYRTESTKKDMIVLNVKEEKDIRELIDVINQFENIKLYNQISEIYYGEKNIILLLKDGIEFKTSKNIPENKYVIAYQLYSKLKKEGTAIKYIDLSSENNQLIVK